MSVQYRIYKDATGCYRDGVRSGKYVIDKSLTGDEDGFDLAEGVGWENIETHE
jgi:hypothetical protein